MPRRIWSLVAAVAVLLGIVVSGQPAAAQDAGYTVTLDVWTCNMSGGLPGMTVAEVVNESGIGRNCVEGARGIGSITLNGQAGMVAGSQIVWNGVFGDVEIFAPVAGVSGGSRTITSDTSLVATFFISDLTPEASLPTGPGTVYIGLQECLVATGPSSVITPYNENPSSMDFCQAARVDAKEWGLRVDGRRPDAFEENLAVWANLAEGTHVATTATGARYEFTAGDRTVSLIARFGPDGAVSPDATVTPLPNLPNTGAGAEASGGSPMAGVLVAALVTLTLAGVGSAIRRSGRS